MVVLKVMRVFRGFPPPLEGVHPRFSWKSKRQLSEVVENREQASKDRKNLYVHVPFELHTRPAPGIQAISMLKPPNTASMLERAPAPERDDMSITTSFLKCDVACGVLESEMLSVNVNENDPSCVFSSADLGMIAVY